MMARCHQPFLERRSTSVQRNHGKDHKSFWICGTDDEPVEMFGVRKCLCKHGVPRYRTSAQVTTCTSGSGGTKDIPLGMLLYDVREDTRTARS